MKVHPAFLAGVGMEKYNRGLALARLEYFLGIITYSN